MAMNTKNFTLNPVQTGVVLKEVQNLSAFQAASKLVELSEAGVILSSLSPTDATWVGEGEKKPVIDTTVKEVTIVAKKLAKTVVWTEEAGQGIPNLEAKLMEDGLPALARAFDKTVAGEKNAPSGFDHLDAVTNSVNIVTLSDITDAETPLGVDTGATSFVINKAMLYALKRLTTPSGARLLDIEKENEFTGTIDGIRYFIFASDSTDAKGFAGPFETSAYWGVIPGSVEVRELRGAYEDESGQVRPMDQYNMKGFVVEGRFGYAVEDLALFKKITVGAEVEGE